MEYPKRQLSLNEIASCCYDKSITGNMHYERVHSATNQGIYEEQLIDHSP